MSLRKRRGLIVAEDVEKVSTGISVYDDNRFIRVQGKVPTRKEIIQAIEFIPHIKPEDCLLSSEERKQRLNYISYFHFPRILDIKTVEKILAMQNEGYMCRDNKRVEDVDSDEYQYKNIFIPRALGIFGASGCGKTTIINRIQEMYYEGIIHSGKKGDYREEYCLQIPMVKINIPAHCTTKSVCMRILMEIDKVAIKLNEFKREKGEKKSNTDYTNRYRFPNVEALLRHVEATIKTNAIGILVLDEIHNIKGAAAADRAKLLNFFVELSNEVKVPLVFIGTESAITLFTEEFQNGRRLCTETPTIFTPFNYNEEWEIFLENLLTLQWIRKPISYSEEVSAFLFELSHGIPDVVIKVFKGAQENAINTGKEELSIDAFICEYQKRCILIDDHLAAMDEWMVPYRLKNVAQGNKKNKKNKTKIFETKINSDMIINKTKEEKLTQILIQMNYSPDESKKISTNVVSHLEKDASLEQMLNIILAGYREDKQVLKTEEIRKEDLKMKPTGLLKIYDEMDKTDRKDKRLMYNALKINGYIAEKSEFI